MLDSNIEFVNVFFQFLFFNDSFWDYVEQISVCLPYY